MSESTNYINDLIVAISTLNTIKTTKKHNVSMFIDSLERVVQRLENKNLNLLVERFKDEYNSMENSDILPLYYERIFQSLMQLLLCSSLSKFEDVA